MRVIAGKAKHLPLQTPLGMDTRPTTDRIKETLFNMIQCEIPGCCFLDLFSGSGGIGIEALSRGAEKAIFVEKDRKACDCIKENLTFTHLSEKAILYQSDVLQILGRLDQKDPFDFVFMDPPYDHELEKKVLEILAGSDLADEYTTIIVEASLQTDFTYLDALGYDLVKYKKYKTNAHVFIKKKERINR